MLEQDFIRCPIGDSIEPTGARIQKEQRKAEHEKQNPFRYFEQCDQLEISNAIRRSENFRFNRVCRHTYLRFVELS